MRMRRFASNAEGWPSLGFASVVGWMAVGCGAGVAFADTPHTFRFDPPGDARQVSVAGTFNGWAAGATPMADADGDGTFEVTLPLPDGVHHYKFVADGAWLNDPASDKELEVGDNFGGVNSAVLVGPDARKLPPPEQGGINAQGVIHDPSDPAEFSVTSDGLLRLGLRAQEGDVESASAHLHAQSEQDAELRPLHVQLGYESFATLFQVGRHGWKVDYIFKLRDGAAELTLPADSYFRAGLDAAPDVPLWARDAVWYHVFPERFRNGDPSNDPEGTKPWTSDWWATLEGEAPGSENFYANAGNVWRRRYGGDLQGLREKLPYLRELGVNAIYLTPIFEAASPHKYDATDHRHVDDNFGVVEDPATLAHVTMPAETEDEATWRWTPSDLVFLDFLDAAHAQGFRVIIDGVFNHVGLDHFGFQDVLRKGKDSPYAGWFEITSWGDPALWGKEPWWEHHGKAAARGAPGTGGIQWKAWDGDNGDLPTFVKDDKLGLAPPVREHMMAVTRRWMRPVVDGVERRGVDGWRLDVPHDVPMAFWRDWRKLVKELNPEALIIGEVWGDAGVWLKGDTFDAVMNYQFAMAAEQFFVDRQTATTPAQLGGRLTDLYMDYPLASALVMQNLIVSHDTERLASLFRNPDRNYDQNSRLQDGANYDVAKPTAEDVARQKQALVVQYLFPGAPMTYYGDEVGMWGPDDPNNRMPMVWEDLGKYEGAGVEVNEELFEFYRRLAAIRHSYDVTDVGFFRTVEAGDDGLYAFVRELGEERVYVVANRSAKPQAVAGVLEEADAGKVWVNVLDAAAADVVRAEDGRPRIELGGARVELTELRPWESAVLVEAR